MQNLLYNSVISLCPAILEEGNGVPAVPFGVQDMFPFPHVLRCCIHRSVRPIKHRWYMRFFWVRSYEVSFYLILKKEISKLFFPFLNKQKKFCHSINKEHIPVHRQMTFGVFWVQFCRPARLLVGDLETVTLNEIVLVFGCSRRQPSPRTCVFTVHFY